MKEDEENLTDKEIGKLAALARNSGMTPNEYSKELLMSVGSLGVSSIEEGKTSIIWDVGKSGDSDLDVIVMVGVLPEGKSSKSIRIHDLWGTLTSVN